MRTSTKVRTGSIFLLVTAAIILRGASPGVDRLILSGKYRDERVYAVINTPGIRDSIITVTSDTFDIGRFSGNRGSIFIVSERHRPTFIPDVAWSDLSDRIIAQLAPYDTIRLSAHILTDDVDGARRMLAEQVDEANRIFRNERTGLTFRVDSIAVESRSRSIPRHVIQAFAGRFDEACLASPDKIARHFFVPGRINIYYVDNVSVGENLAWRHEISTDGSKVVIGIPVSLNVPSILAHELGHALGLRHPEPSQIARRASMATQHNVMHDRSSVRAFFSDGQIFLMNFSVASALRNVYRRSRPYIDCGADTSSVCPEISLDIWSDPYPVQATTADPASPSRTSH